MRKFEAITEPIELDFYQIDEQDGVKYIHLYGYNYWGDNWTLNEIYGGIMPLSTFVAEMKENSNYVNDFYSDMKQGCDDIGSDEEMVNIINTYFNGHTADFYLNFNEVNEDTPCGCYVADNNNILY